MNRRNFVRFSAGTLGAAAFPFRALAASNVAGLTHTFKYKHWSGQNWSASLENIHMQFPGLSVSDPDFEHVGPDPGNTYNHKDEWIEYITGDGSLWHSKCHSHNPIGATGPTPVSFTFEHFPKGSKDKHEDSRLEFLDWEGKCWELTVPNCAANNDQIVMVSLAVGPKH